MNGLTLTFLSWRVGTQETKLKYAWEREMWSTTFGNLGMKTYRELAW